MIQMLNKFSSFVDFNLNKLVTKASNPKLIISFCVKSILFIIQFHFNQAGKQS